jgi:hypothetical protein
MVTRTEVREGITRLIGIWPTLARRDALRQEIGNAVMRHADRLQAVDIGKGLDDLIARARAQQNDGGPAAPPGPHEVLGCILAARDARTRNTPRPRYEPGMSFGEWWASLPEGERVQHRALHAMMAAREGDEGLAHVGR